jgi:2-desacetyl-2-hydroxyethyl bacteriochlorophyllide A dehydrogenase
MKHGDRVLVVGAGPIGLAALYWAKRAGAGRVAVTASSNRREALALSMGADAFVTPEEGRSLARGSAQALGGSADIVLECVGVPGMLDLSVSCVRRGGTVLVLGFCMEPELFRASAAMTREAKLQFAILYSREEFQICVDALDAGAVSPRAMITDVVSLDDLPTAFEALRSRTTQCKVLIDPSA